MIFKVKNSIVSQASKFFYDLPLKGRQSRHRSKLVKILDAHIEEVAEAERLILEEHCEKDESGAFKKINNDTHWAVRNPEAFGKDKMELMNEEVVVDGGANEAMLKTVRNILFEYDGELSGTDAELYDVLCNEFEDQDDDNEVAEDVAVN